MKKIYKLLLFVVIILILSSCNNSSSNKNINTSISEDINYMDKTLILKIDDTIVNVSWENNESVNELKRLSINNLILNLSEYGGFEQTGPIGNKLPSKDSNINVIPGDIVLYNSKNISIFYNNSSWSYTRLGHINLDKNELNNLLNKDNVTITLSLE